MDSLRHPDIDGVLLPKPIRSLSVRETRITHRRRVGADEDGFYYAAAGFGGCVYAHNE